MSELKACPLCGEKPILLHTLFGLAHTLCECIDCGLIMVYEKWQQRPLDDALRVENESLRSALLVVLDSVDYLSGACLQNEMVGAVLSKVVIDNARKVLK